MKWSIAVKGQAEDVVIRRFTDDRWATGNKTLGGWGSSMKTVLIVEDDKNIARAMGVRLGAHGYRVAHAYDAITALMVAKSSQPDLVVLDISMPGGDGFVVAERLRRWKGDEIPLIFVTASQKPGLAERAESFDAACFLQKPFSGRDFVASVVAAI